MRSALRAPLSVWSEYIGYTSVHDRSCDAVCVLCVLCMLCMQGALMRMSIPSIHISYLIYQGDHPSRGCVYTIQARARASQERTGGVP